MNPIQITHLSYPNENRYTATFRLENTNVAYANTLRRLMVSAVESVAFDSSMDKNGTTTDVTIEQNDTPMTNEMLADRIGLLPIHVTEPLTWNPDEYLFILDKEGKRDQTTYVTASDFVVHRRIRAKDANGANDDDAGDEKDGVETIIMPTDQFFPPHPVTGDTCLLAVLAPTFHSEVQRIRLTAVARKGTGRTHARYFPVTRATYEYVTYPKDDPKQTEAFHKWLEVTKKIQENVNDPAFKASTRYQSLLAEYNTMEYKRCYLTHEKTGEPYQFDFHVESVGVLPVPYIIRRACDIAESMLGPLAILGTGPLPADKITIQMADARLNGFDFLIKGHDTTLGNMLQAYMDEFMIGSNDSTITFAGFKIPHPLRDELLFRLGVESGNEMDARKAIATAANGCIDLFQAIRRAWDSAVSS